MNFQFKKNREEAEIMYSKQNQEEHEYGWKDLLKSFWRSWVRKVITYLVLPLVILNFWLFRYDDYANDCHIKIHPALLEWNNLQIKKGIRLLKEKSFLDYKEMCAAVESISPELACGGMGGGCFNSAYPHEIVISTIFRLKESHTEQTAAFIAHEVCHLYQYKEGRAMDETECYQDYCRILNIMEVRKDYDGRCKDGNYIGG